MIFTSMSICVCDDVEIGDGSERRTGGESEVAWSDSGAGEADEDV